MLSMWTIKWPALVLALSMFPGTFVAGHQVLNIVWSDGTFSTTMGDGYNSGLAIIDADTKEKIYNGLPADYSPCGFGGYTFTFSGGGLSSPLKFSCIAKFNGSPSKCIVKDSSNHEIASAKGQNSEKFVGFSVISDGYCGTSITLENDHLKPHDKFHIKYDK